MIGSATGTSTPHTASSLRPLVLTHGRLEHALLIPNALYFASSQLRAEFALSLPEATDELALDEEPSSVPDLVSRFLYFVAQKVEEQPGLYEQVLALVLAEFESRFLRGNEVHSVASGLPGIFAKRRDVVKSYYYSRLVAQRPIKAHESALFRAVSDDQAKVYTIFGGQGNIEEYFEETREIYNVYNNLLDDFFESCGAILVKLARDPRAGKVYSKGLDIMRWLREPGTTPDLDYLVSAPVSLPLIGVTQLAHYAVTCRILGKHPGELRELLSGATGHSQGIITAAAISAAADWESFEQATRSALQMLFWIGCRGQQIFPRTTLAPTALRDSEAEGEGFPTPMLSVRDLRPSEVQKHIDETNKFLPKDRHVAIALVNGPRNLVVAGPPQSLYGLNLALRKVKAPTGLDQNRVPFKQRKVRFVNRFLPITAPFHSPFLEASTSTVVEDIEQCSFAKLAIPVFDTHTGADLSELSPSALNSRLVELITTLPVQWEKATTFQGATHIVDFGPGGVSGVGTLSFRNKDGTGVRVIIGGAIEGPNAELGYKSELFDREDGAVKYAANWVKEHAPELVKTLDGRTFVSTSFSRLLGVPPIMVAGMTPCTVPWDFVAATMNAGYHIELAGGGYFRPAQLKEALTHIEENTNPGRGITLNLIYVNPRAFAWQIPLVRELRAAGTPVEGICIGAGVPSLEVATELIETLGIKHISFKPGSMDAIQAVVNIARANPNFPCILQWTGGRAGGHHSFEDFHAPILQSYSRIRRCKNIILVAGSGFGGAEDTYPYLTGDWALKYEFPPMPFDGVLFGSRMMTAKEAHTSQGAKQAILEAPGLEDHEWEQTYKGSAGGIITVLSEMGEPIHKLATRGVLFWNEMDKTIFSLPKAKRVDALRQKREYIIKRLDDDFQKPWFGRNAAGECVDLEDMTYAEITRRMVELLYIKHQSRWIDTTHRNLTGDWIRRLEERFTTVEGHPSLLQIYSDLDRPFKTVDSILHSYPDANTQIINAQDHQHFLLLCARLAQKPVPFVPALDDNFEYWFKKDSLWQAEDVEALVDQDVGRCAILQGPMAAKFTTKINRPIKEILDEIHNDHIRALNIDCYEKKGKQIPVVEYFGGQKIDADLMIDLESVETRKEAERIVYRLASDSSFGSLPSTKEWLTLLGGDRYSWRHALFTTDIYVQGHKYEDNPIRRIFKPEYGVEVTVAHPNTPDMTVISVHARYENTSQLVVEIRKLDLQIQVLLFEHRNADRTPIPLQLLFTYHPSEGYAPLREVMEGRNDRIKEFYYKLWFGVEAEPDMNATVMSMFEGGQVHVKASAIADFCHSVGNAHEAYVETADKPRSAPMDFAIVVGWKAIIKAIFAKAIDGDLLRLVHLSNGFRMHPGAEPLRKDDVVETRAQINSVLNQDSGKMVEVCGTIVRDGKPVMDVTSQFLYRGNYTDYENTFQRKMETPMQLHLQASKDVAVLRSKEWIQFDDSEMSLLGKTLIFRLHSFVGFKDEAIFSSVETRGQVLLELPTKEIIQVASVEYECGESHGNPVVDYLARHGSTIEQPITFENSIPLGHGSELIFKAPSSNEGYARVSGDYNPIHVSPIFSRYANLKGAITHGMYSSAAVRSLVETWAADNIVARVRSFTCSFVGMVLPNDSVEVKLVHVGMVAGCKTIKVEARNKDSDEVIITGEAEVEQPVSSYVFTGQGSQEQGMGMDLYDSSEVARNVWDRADKHFLDNYGFSIIHIVRINPRELTVHFGGPRGKAIRQNYMSMTFESVAADGQLKSERIFKTIGEQSNAYTFHSPQGLLSATQFTQPALTLMEKASFEDMKSKGLVQRDCSFAGHSLGEYSALAALGDVMPIESLVDIVFYRGMTMQVAVPRDSEGRSNYGMCAVNPSRIAKSFNDAALRYVVEHISAQTEWLLEIVNYNVADQQYVCAGDLRGLDCLSNVLNFLRVQKVDLEHLMQTLSLEEVKSRLSEIVAECARKTESRPKPLELERGFATIPLKGIDVPFHSTFLRSGVKPFRSFLTKKVPRTALNPNKLIGKYIPNVTASPFRVTKEYFEEVYKLTGSPKLGSILANWDDYEQRV